MKQNELSEMFLKCYKHMMKNKMCKTEVLCFERYPETGPLIMDPHEITY